jgi:hypothetical protein
MFAEGITARAPIRGTSFSSAAPAVSAAHTRTAIEIRFGFMSLYFISFGAAFIWRLHSQNVLHLAKSTTADRFSQKNSAAREKIARRPAEKESAWFHEKVRIGRTSTDPYRAQRILRQWPPPSAASFASTR